MAVGQLITQMEQNKSLYTFTNVCLCTRTRAHTYTHTFPDGLRLKVKKRKFMKNLKENKKGYMYLKQSYY